MAVGDVERLDAAEQFDQPGDRRRVGNSPDRVADPVRRRDVVERLGGADTVHDGIDLRLGAVGKKHRLGIGVLLGDVPGAIVFLIAPREFVFLDAILLVLPNRAERDQTGLDVLSHALLVDVERILGLARENAARR